MKKYLSKILLIAILALAFFLRLYKLDTLLPPYWEEVALGYDAFSISQTLKDHHGNFLPITAFASFGDYKPSLYFYAASIFVKILGLNVLAVRLPSLISGILIIIGVGYLTKLIIKNNYLSLLSMFITAISPWAILFSRAAWEVNLATALVLWGVILFFKFIKNNKLIYLLSSCLLLILSIYTYHATRIISPLLGSGLVILWASNYQNIKKFLKLNFKKIIIILILSLILISPILINLNNKTTSQRFAETSIFSNLEIIKESNLRRETQPGLISKIFYHRYILFSREILKNYLSHFNLNFLFISGDQNPRHSVQYFGQLYHIELVFLLLGVFFIFNLTPNPSPSQERGTSIQQKQLLFLIFWLLISIIPASITKASPHALRILPLMPVVMILITLGIYQLLSFFSAKGRPASGWKNKLIKKLLIILIILFYLLELAVFWRFYTKIYKVKYASEWQYGYEQLFTELNQVDFDGPIYITREQGRPAMYYWFYNQTNPKHVQAWELEAKKDQGEFLEFNNLKFINSVAEVLDQNALVIASPAEINKLTNQNINQLFEIKNLNNQIIWQAIQIYEN